MAYEAAPTSGRLDRLAFTLIELLVSIGIIAVLIAILTPALLGARNVARDTKCLSNQKQIALGWIVYTTERRQFPHHPLTYSEVEQNGQTTRVPNLADIPMHLDWGGVDWHTDAGETTLWEDERALNPYIGSDGVRETARKEIFLCPRDTATLFYATGESHHEFSYGNINGYGPNLIGNSDAEDAAETTYGVIGTSYFANEWIWARIGSRTGWRGNGSLFGNVVWTNKPTDVDQPSKFVLTGDGGPFYAGRMTEEGRLNANGGLGAWYGWWHGVEACNIAFFDGSARRTMLQPGKAAAEDYSFYFDRRFHEPWSWVIGWIGDGTPPPPPDPADEEG